MQKGNHQSQKFKTYLIDGVHHKRIKITDPSGCSVCCARRNQLHEICCYKELSPCKNHEFVILCDCNVWKDIAV